MSLNDIAEKCIQLQDRQVHRKHHIKLENKITNQTIALVARVCGYDPNMEESTRKKFWKRGEGIVSRALKVEPKMRLMVKPNAPKTIKLNEDLDVTKHFKVIEELDVTKHQLPEDLDVVHEVRRDLEVACRMMPPIYAERKRIDAEMEEIAEALPGGELIEATPGFGRHGLAVIVGEVGNLLDYPGVYGEDHPLAGQRRPNYQGRDCLWKRLGLALVPGFEDRACSTLRKAKGLTEEERIFLWGDKDHEGHASYSPQRLGQIYGVVTIPLFMAKSKNKFGAIYDRRIAHTRVTQPEWKPIHRDWDGRRYITKLLIRDLYREWRRWEASQRASDNTLAA